MEDIFAVFDAVVVEFDERDILSPNVCPPSLLILISGVSVPSKFLSHHVTYTLLSIAFICILSEVIPSDKLKLISLPKVPPLSLDTLRNTSGW